MYYSLINQDAVISRVIAFKNPIVLFLLKLDETKSMEPVFIISEARITILQ